MAPHVYLCSVCLRKSTHPGDEPDPVCNNSDRCGLLFPEERLIAPHPRRLRFEIDGRDYAPGDDRSYDVLHHGVVIGIVERGYGPAGGSVWDFNGSVKSGDRKVGLYGSGESRAAAVTAAYT